MKTIHTTTDTQGHPAACRARGVDGVSPNSVATLPVFAAANSNPANCNAANSNVRNCVMTTRRRVLLA